jgi:hypothetical protein
MEILTILSESLYGTNISTNFVFVTKQMTLLSVFVTRPHTSSYEIVDLYFCTMRPMLKYTSGA